MIEPKIKHLFKLNKRPLAEAQLLFEHFHPLLEAIITHYNPSRNKLAYAFNNADEIKQLFKLISMNPYGQYLLYGQYVLLEELKDLRKDMAKSSPNSANDILKKPVIGYWVRNNELNSARCNIATDAFLKELEVLEINVLSAEEILDSNLFKGGLALLDFVRFLDDITNRDMKTYTYKYKILESIRHNQDFIDYAVKCKTIGESPRLIKALIEKDDDWHSAFFAPIHAINKSVQRTPSDVTNNLYIEEDVEQELDDLMAWSSSKIYAVDKPTDLTLPLDAIAIIEAFNNLPKE